MARLLRYRRFEKPKKKKKNESVERVANCQNNLEILPRPGKRRW